MSDAELVEKYGGMLLRVEEERDALRARVAQLEAALEWIAITFTEDSHGNMKTLPASDYQDHARVALKERGERK